MQFNKFMPVKKKNPWRAKLSDRNLHWLEETGAWFEHHADEMWLQFHDDFRQPERLDSSEDICCDGDPACCPERGEPVEIRPWYHQPMAELEWGDHKLWYRPPWGASEKEKELVHRFHLRRLIERIGQ